MVTSILTLRRKTWRKLLGTSTLYPAVPSSGERTPQRACVYWGWQCGLHGWDLVSLDMQLPRRREWGTPRVPNEAPVWHKGVWCGIK